jgi:hypothetical protein
MTNAATAAQLTTALAGDRRLRRIFFEALETAEAIISRTIAGITDDEPAADLLCELDWQLRHEHPVPEETFQLVWGALLDHIYYRCAAADAAS